MAQEVELRVVHQPEDQQFSPQLLQSTCHSVLRQDNADVSLVCERVWTKAGHVTLGRPRLYSISHLAHGSHWDPPGGAAGCSWAEGHTGHLGYHQPQSRPR